MSFSFAIYPIRSRRFADGVVDRPLIAGDVAQAAVYMLNQPLNVSIKALDVVPSGECSSLLFGDTLDSLIDANILQLNDL